jgi:Uma2 family endonuclease
MSIVIPSSLPSPLPPPFPVRRFTVAEYHRMVRADVLHEGDAVELLEGWIAPKTPRSPRRDATVDRCHGTLGPLLPDPWRIRVQSAITTADSEPEPDLAIVVGPAQRYSARHPGPLDVGLAIEVSDSSLAHDRTIKAAVYAQAGISVYWIINLVDDQLEVYTDPMAGAAQAYGCRTDFRLADRVPLLLAGATIATLVVADLIA